MNATITMAMMEAFIALMMEAVSTTATLVYFNETTQRYIQNTVN
jgi:hypothetical protein